MVWCASSSTLSIMLSPPSSSLFFHEKIKQIPFKPNKKHGQKEDQTTEKKMRKTYIFPHNIVTRHSVTIALQNSLLVNHSSGEMKSSFGNVILVTLFKCCGNTCEWKSVVKICVVLCCLNNKNCCLNNTTKQAQNLPPKPI